jgi:dimethylaniline monooxygenase (N-oxide forming)
LHKLWITPLVTAKSAQLQQRRVAVIGAGPAGLVTAKTLKDKGFKVVVYEKGSMVGGAWVYDNDNGRNYLYRNLHINTSRKLTQFADFPFDAATQRIPDHRDMARYLKAYAHQFDLYSLIRFRTDVVAIRPPAPGAAGDMGWTVRTADSQEDAFDAIVVCTGPFARAAHAEEVRGGFAGEYLHSSGYRAPEAFVGKRVCIIGAGNSAVDIASDICTTAARTVLVARSPVLVMPHFVLGRAIGDIGALLQRRFIPTAFRRKVMGWLIRAVHGEMTSHGFKPLTHRVHATISSTIIQDILFERVAVKQGIATIADRDIGFVDGSREQFDCIIAATGFVTEFPFLSEDIVRPVNNRLDLYKRIAAPGWPGLYFVGMINLDTPINHACERQAQWIARVESEALILPSEDDMRADIAAKQVWVEEIFGHAVRHSLQEDSVKYYAELARALRLGWRRKAARDGARKATRLRRWRDEPRACVASSVFPSSSRSTNP